MIRRTIMRYVILGISYSMTLFSINVRKRFNTLEDFVSFGLLEEDEIPIIRKMAEKTQKVYWLPLVWAGTMTATARKEGRVENDLAMKTILDEIVKLRLLCAKCSSMVMVNVPLSYSQVVTWAVYGFFAACLIGRQFVAGDSDIYVPVFTILQFLVYMGWLKVAEALINPFGEDDDDFQLLTLIERGLEKVIDEEKADNVQYSSSDSIRILLKDNFSWSFSTTPAKKKVLFRPERDRIYTAKDLLPTGFLPREIAGRSSGSPQEEVYPTTLSRKYYITSVIMGVSGDFINDDTKDSMDEGVCE
ncbi:unnamed protein product [Notodromas monacha]|uniref:Bestrophin homolog n=1 Tax=Notodromas monacha TaxID=399045 RepID=A0A7R9BYW1_9CRUS|nr:unnamed protein product [Notodromas monacha]CAG0923886.1 unnamed protein product [Notodromas monacha]